MSLRVVFDTNILFSAVGWRGAPYRCLELARSGDIESVTCDAILDELIEKLQIKRGMPAHEALRIAAEVAAFSTKVQTDGTLRVVADDPDDDVVVECAVAGRASCIVSGDRHLLALTRYQSVEIVSSSEILDRINSAPDREPGDSG